jgi:hypothetical protein
MDPNVQGSFIPKQALTAASRGSGAGLFFLLALLVFVMSVVAAGGAFAYQQYLNGQITSKDKMLKTAEGAFDAGAIQDLVRMDARLTQARTLLQSHVSPSAIFAFLSTVTLQKVQFDSFDLSVNKDGSATMALGGSADSFSTVALQSDQLGSSKVLRDVVFSGITVGENGKVSFTVNATVDPSLILYRNNLTQQGVQQ